MAFYERDAAMTEAEVLQAIRKDLKTDDFKLLEYSLNSASDNPLLGFMSVHYKLQAKVEIEGEFKSVQYFAKQIANSEYGIGLGVGAFKKEIGFYERVLRDVENNKTPGRNLTKWHPEFYFARGSEFIVIEDLSLKDYYMYPERTPLDLDHVMKMVKAMAPMHAGPMILEEKLKQNRALVIPEGWTKGDPADPAHLYPDLTFETEASADPEHYGNIYYEAGIRSQLAIVDLLPDLSQPQKEKIKQCLPNILRRLFELAKPSTVYRNTWLHGDLWSNNMMFHKNSDGKVDQAIIIDFQAARIAPPAHDLMMFMHLVQTKEFRDKHLKHIQKEYYAEFTKEVEAEGFDVEAILPYKEFIESCAHYYEYSLLSQVLFYQLILCPPDISSKFLSSKESFEAIILVDRTQMISEAFKTDEIFRTRMTEGMMELIHLHKLAD